MPGDSHLTITDEEYKLAFIDTLSYQEQQMTEANDHFPLFLMGNSLTTLVRARQSAKNHLKEMKTLRHESLQLKMVCNREETFLFNLMTSDE